ncbi:MAG TPA: thiamine pyrophosphate-binding protein, partial [Herbaspirillum sp.]
MTSESGKTTTSTPSTTSTGAGAIPAGRKTARRYGSDFIVDILQQYGIPFAAFNPGASFRGIHDSLVNYLGN